MITQLLMMYFVIYLLPPTILLAQYAPDLEVWPRLGFAGNRLPRQTVPVLWRLTMANLAIGLFCNLAITPQPWLIILAWEWFYLWFAVWVGPWLMLSQPAVTPVHAA